MQLFTIKLTGSTYPHREVFRVLDYSWDPEQKAWVKHNVEFWDTKIAVANTLNDKWPGVTTTVICQSKDRASGYSCAGLRKEP